MWNSVLQHARFGVFTAVNIQVEELHSEDRGSKVLQNDSIFSILPQNYTASQPTRRRLVTYDTL
jgi:hypothetical protein